VKASASITNYYYGSAPDTGLRPILQQAQELLLLGWGNRVPVSASTPPQFDSVSARAIGETDLTTTSSSTPWFNDFWQLSGGDLPIYVRVTWKVARHNSIYELIPQVSWSLGIDANGLTGTVLDGPQAHGNTTQSNANVPQTWFAASQEGMLTFTCGSAYTYDAYSFAYFERYCDYSGITLTGAKAGAIGLMAGKYTSNNYHQMIRADGYTGSTTSSAPGVVALPYWLGGPLGVGSTSASGSSVYEGSKVAVIPVHGWTTEPCTLKYLLMGKAGDLPIDAPFQAANPVGGGVGTYQYSGTAKTGTWQAGVHTIGAAYRWE
jgi:hypothetical protein